MFRDQSKRVTYHRDTLRHVVHSIGCVSPRLNNNSGILREIERADLTLYPLVSQADSLHRLHVVGINVRMLPLDMLLPDDLFVVEIDEELKQLVLVAAPLDDNLDPGVPSRSQPQRLLAMLFLQEIDHLPLGRLQQGDDPEVGLLPSKVRAHHPRSLQT